jgi:diguanylate cyclase (GGDEF)-like protein
MAKRDPQILTPAGKPRPMPAAVRPRPRRQSLDEGDQAAAKPSRALAMRLAAEVQRLEAELAATRDRLAELERCADIDPLTELLNRRGFDRELRRALAYLARYRATAALIYLDLDRFKPINDRHGHAVGDAVLQAVAVTLAGGVRGSDLVARLGGDEFVVLLWNLDRSQARTKADALEGAVAGTRVEHAGSQLSVGASAGVALLEAADDVAAAVARADAAMYARKAERAGAASAAAPAMLPPSA